MRQKDITLLVGYASSEEECIKYCRYYLKKGCKRLKTTVTKINKGTVQEPDYKYYLVFEQGKEIISDENLLFGFEKISILKNEYSTYNEMYGGIAYFTQLGYDLMDIATLKITKEELISSNGYVAIFRRSDLSE